MALNRLAVAATIVLAAAGTAGAQAPPGGPEFQLNVTVAGDQADAAVAVEADGGYVVAWRSGTSIVARRLDAAGTPRSGELAVSLTPLATPGRPTVAAAPGGGFLVAWHGPDASGQGILARWFDASGQAAGGEIPVNVATGGDQVDPKVSGGPLGYVMAWTSGGASVVGRLLSSNGVPLGVEIPVGAGHSAAVAWRGNGIVFAWTDSSGAGPVFVRLFEGTGAPAGPATIANGPNPFMPPFGIGSYTRHSIGVSAAASGAFTVSWDLEGFSASGGFLPMPFWYVQFGSYLRRYDPSGAPLAHVNLNTYTDGAQEQPSLAVAPGGTTFVAWTSFPVVEGCSGPPSCWPPPPLPAPQDGSGAGVYARLFDAGGADIGGGEFRVNLATAGEQREPAVARSDFGMLAVFEVADGSGTGLMARRFGHLLEPAGLAVDPTDEQFSDGNGVLENWEAVVVAPAWHNGTGTPQVVTSAASAFSGPPGATYEIFDPVASFGLMPNGATVSCGQTGDCFGLTVYGSRTAAHWDTQFTESVQPGALFGPRTRVLHVGDSFADVPRTSPFYRFVETVFHNDVMPACVTGWFCPTWSVTRETMAPFVLKAAAPGFTPPACVAGSERFVDVPAASPYCPWIEELARRRVIAGCGSGTYCPQAAVSRETLPVYLLLTKEGTGYVPPACTTPVFADVPAASPFCRWIEELARRGIVGGCGNGRYCPFLSVARDQMSVFVGATFGLLLYAP